MPLPDSLRDLLTAPGPSGRESAAAVVWQARARTFTDDVTVDVMGNSVARVPGLSGGPLLAVVGHIDEIGLAVTHIDDEGMLYLGPIGGWDPSILLGQRVEILTRGGAVPGVLGRKPVHLMEEDERGKNIKLHDLHIDIGARDGDEARSLVRIGDAAVLAGDPVQLRGDRWASRSLDNRLGCYVALEAARRIADVGGAPGPVAAVAAVQEEVGSYGARTMAYGLEPDVAIAVDVTHATDAPGVDEKREGKHPLGAGTVIARGTTLHPLVFELLHDAAEAEDIPFAVEAMTGRGTFTDADSIHVSRRGVPTGLLGIPLRYMHSPVELVELGDVEATVRLVVAFAQRLSAETTFVR